MLNVIPNILNKRMQIFIILFAFFSFLIILNSTYAKPQDVSANLKWTSETSSMMAVMCNIIEFATTGIGKLVLVFVILFLGVRTVRHEFKIISKMPTNYSARIPRPSFFAAAATRLRLR